MNTTGSCPVPTNADKIWTYDQNYRGEKDADERKNGYGEYHWSGAEVYLLTILGLIHKFNSNLFIYLIKIIEFGIRQVYIVQVSASGFARVLQGKQVALNPRHYQIINSTMNSPESTSTDTLIMISL